MLKSATSVLDNHDRILDGAKQVTIVVGASLFVALCARVTLPLPFTPVPLTLQNFGVLAVGLTLGSRRGFAALALYLAEGHGRAAGVQPNRPGWPCSTGGADGRLSAGLSCRCRARGLDSGKRPAHSGTRLDRQHIRRDCIVCQRAFVAGHPYSFCLPRQCAGGFTGLFLLK